MKKLILSLSLCFFIFHIVLAQTTGTISGIITAPDGPVVQATVQVKGLPSGEVSDLNGQYVFEGIPSGNQTIIVRAIGFQTLTKKVEVKAGSTTELDIKLQADNLNLNEVVVSGTRYELDRSESPVIVNVVSSKLFNATQSIALSEGLNFRPGVRVETNCQNCGFTQVRLNGLEGGYSQILVNSRAVFSALNSVYGLKQISANFVERVEVVRSGGSALYGSNVIAGTINIITKDPVENTWQIGTNFALIDGSTPDNTVNFNGSLVNEDLNSRVTFYGMFRNRDSYDANGDGFTEMTLLENNTFGIKAIFEARRTQQAYTGF